MEGLLGSDDNRVSAPRDIVVCILARQLDSPSLASAPLLQKKALSPHVLLTSHLASSACEGIKQVTHMVHLLHLVVHSLLQGRVRVTQATSRDAAVQSKYSFPSKSNSEQPYRVKLSFYSDRMCSGQSHRRSLSLLLQKLQKNVASF